MKEALKQIMDQTCADDYLWKQALYDGARLYYENQDYLVNLLQHTSGHDSMSKALAMFDDDYVTRQSRASSRMNRSTATGSRGISAGAMRKRTAFRGITRRSSAAC